MPTLSSTKIIQPVSTRGVRQRRHKSHNRRNKIIFLNDAVIHIGAMKTLQSEVISGVKNGSRCKVDNMREFCLNEEKVKKLKAFKMTSKYISL